MLSAVWFDSGLRGTPARLTTNGWVTGGGGSTRSAGDGDPAHHERGWAADEGCSEDGRVGDGGRTKEGEDGGLGLVASSGGWFDMGRRVRTPGSPRTGWVTHRFSPRLGCGGLCGSTRFSEGLRTGSPRTVAPRPTGSEPAHHERARLWTVWVTRVGLSSMLTVAWPMVVGRTQRMTAVLDFFVAEHGVEDLGGVDAGVGRRGGRWRRGGCSGG